MGTTLTLLHYCKENGLMTLALHLETGRIIIQSHVEIGSVKLSIIEVKDYFYYSKKQRLRWTSAALNRN